jgi:hypothetical protein
MIKGGGYMFGFKKESKPKPFLQYTKAYGKTFVEEIKPQKQKERLEETIQPSYSIYDKQDRLQEKIPKNKHQEKHEEQQIDISV